MELLPLWVCLALHSPVPFLLPPSLLLSLRTPIPKLQSEIIAKDMSFETLVNMARALELMQREVAFMKSNPLENATNQMENNKLTSSQTDHDHGWSLLLTHVTQWQHHPGSPQPTSVIIVERKNMWVAVARLEEQHAASATTATILRRYVSQKAFIPCPYNTVQSRHPHLKSTISIPSNSKWTKLNVAFQNRHSQITPTQTLILLSE